MRVDKQNDTNMATLTLERETQNYWSLLKDASDQVKLALISLLSSSLVSKNVELAAPTTEKKPKITAKDLEITPSVAKIGENIKPLPEDFDYQKAKYEYLTEKYK